MSYDLSPLAELRNGVPHVAGFINELLSHDQMLCRILGIDPAFPFEGLGSAGRGLPELVGLHRVLSAGFPFFGCRFRDPVNRPSRWPHQLLRRFL